jgi:hypothetical protein
MTVNRTYVKWTLTILISWIQKKRKINLLGDLPIHAITNQAFTLESSSPTRLHAWTAACAGVRETEVGNEMHDGRERKNRRQAEQPRARCWFWASLVASVETGPKDMDQTYNAHPNEVLVGREPIIRCPGDRFCRSGFSTSTTSLHFIQVSWRPFV